MIKVKMWVKIWLYQTGLDSAERPNILSKFHYTILSLEI